MVSESDNKQSKYGFQELIARIRIACKFTKPKRPESEIHADTVGSGIGGENYSLNELRKLSRKESTLHKPMANSYQRQISASSSRAIIGGQGYHLNLGPSDSNSTTRNYIIADGKIHFWKNFGYEPEVGSFITMYLDIFNQSTFDFRCLFSIFDAVINFIKLIPMSFRC